MKFKKNTLIYCTVAILLLSFSSCRARGFLSDDFKAGETVTPEELLEISREIFTQVNDPIPETETPEPETLASDATVYWLVGGSVYHADRSCHHILHADPENVKEGPISAAEADGKERLCSSCAP